MDKKTCMILRCKNQTAKNRVRQFCQYHKLTFRTLGKNIVVYDDMKWDKKWADVSVVPAEEIIDKVGNQVYM